jgi:hypothetical protein
MKFTAHNIDEVVALTKEMILSGDIVIYNGATWYDHNGNYICRSFTGETQVSLEIFNTLKCYEV